MARKVRSHVAVGIALMVGLTLAAYGWAIFIHGDGYNEDMLRSIVVNFVCLIIICYLCTRWRKVFFSPLKKVIDDLDGFDSFMAKAKNNEETVSTLEFIRENYKECFQTAHVRCAFEKYINELELLDVESSEEYNNCDISDFINYEDICAAVKKSYAENIAASMTGLGILGTFVGLAIGLQFFDASDSTAMAESIVPLMDGIKTAFYTSIYGVVTSLLLNHATKNALDELDLCLDDFYDAYHDNVLAYPDYLLDKQSFDILAEQKEILSSFAESVSVSLSREMKDMMNPIFDRFSQSIEEFTKTVAINQVEGLERIVNSFISNMNEALGEQFSALGETLTKTCEEQQKTIEAMDDSITKVIESADLIKDMNEGLSETVDKFDGYLSKLAAQEDNLVAHVEAYQSTLDKSFEALSGVCQEIEELVDSERKIVEMNESNVELLKENNDRAVEINNQIESNFDRFIEETKSSVENLVEFTRTEFGEIGESIERIYEENSNMMSSVQNQVADSIGVFTSGLRDSINKMIEYTDERFRNVKSTVENLVEFTRTEFGEIGESIERIYEENSNMMSGVQNQVADSIGAFTSGLRESINKMIEYTDERFSNIKSTLQSINEEIQGAEIGLSSAYSKLQGDVDVSLERTFDAFDKQLAEMTGYFSGALSEISENTEKIPSIVNENYSLLNEQTNRYLEAISELEREIRDAVENISRVNEEIESVNPVEGDE